MGVLARCLGAAVLVAAVVQPAFAQVQIKHARWGVADARGRVTGPSCNARQQAMQACEGKESCELPATNTTLGGEPARGRVKTLELSYACGGEPLVTLNVAEFASASLNCARARRDDVAKARDGMRVQSAVWGLLGPSGRVEEPRCNATRELARACNGEQACDVPVKNAALCGDPVVGREKTLEVTYACGRDSQTFSYPESSLAALRCELLDDADRNGRAITVLSAWWGRNAGDGIAHEPACDVTRDVARVCDDKDQCQVSAYSRYLCGDPAPGKVKLLEISYACGRVEKTESFPETAQAILRCDGRDRWRDHWKDGERDRSRRDDDPR